MGLGPRRGSSSRLKGIYINVIYIGGLYVQILPVSMCIQMISSIVELVKHDIS